MGVTMGVAGKLGAAVRFDPPSTTGVDAWLLDLNDPVIVLLHGGDMTLRTQFLISTVRIADMDEAIRPTTGSNTHGIALAPLAEIFDPAWLGRGKVPTVLCRRELFGQHVLYAEFEVLGDHTARAVGRAVAAGIVQGDLPLQGRHVGASFVRGVRMVALALGQVTFAPSVQAVLD